jgi:predicted amidohydrolase
MTTPQPLTISLVQGDTRWHDAPANREYYGGLIRSLPQPSDLIVLPETFLSGFTNAAQEQAERRDGAGLRWLRALAVETGSVITGSLIVGEPGVGAHERCVNRLIWMRPDGSHAHYDKRHLFRMANEQLRYQSGRERLIVELNGWRILPQVCYDLRFPVWLRNRHDPDSQRLDYDLALFVANWPSERREAWRTLLKARAIENLAYTVGVNRVGSDGNQLRYAGDSAAIDFLGQPLVELGAQEAIATITLDPAALAAHRQRFPAWMDADAFSLTT